MFPDLEGITGPLDNRSVITVLDKTKGTSCFLNHHFVSYALKYHKKVVLIGLDQSFGHYHSVGLRLGHNLIKLRGEKRVDFFDGARKILNSVLGTETIFRPGSGLAELGAEVGRLMDEDCFLVLDNVSILANLGFTPRELALFLRDLRIRSTTLGGRMLITFCTSSPDFLVNNLMRNSDMCFVVEDLKTGKSKEVTGHLTIKNRTEYGEMKCSDFHFRVEEKTVKVFPPGTSVNVL